MKLHRSEIECYRALVPRRSSRLRVGYRSTSGQRGSRSRTQELGTQLPELIAPSNARCALVPADDAPGDTARSGSGHTGAERARARTSTRRERTVDEASGDQLEHLVDEDDGEAELQDGPPLDQTERADLEDGLHTRSTTDSASGH